MTIERTDVEEFTRSCNESYEKHSVLPDICTVDDYDQSQHQEMEFVGAGKRVNLPKRFFSDPATSTVAIESDIGRGAFTGERDLFLDQIREKAVQSEIEDYTMERFDSDSVLEILEDYNFTHIFLPWRRESEDNIIEQLHENSKAFLSNGKLFIDRSIGDVQVKIIPSESNLPNNRAYILNKNNVRIAQKRKRDASIPKGMDLIDEYRDIGLDNRLMLYFGESSELSGEFDFLYQILISEPIIEGNGAASIHVPLDF